MTRFIVRRLGQAVASIVAATFLLYIGLFVMGDPFASDQGRRVPPDIHDALWAKFGMDEPLLVRYLIYLRNLFTGDLGIEFERRRPVFDLVAAAVPNTVLLALIVITVQVVIGVGAGVVAALYQRSFLDTLITASTILLMGVPVFVIAIWLRSRLPGLELFGVEIFPLVPTRFTVEVPWYKEVALPALAMSFVEVAIVARLARASMLDVLTADFLRTARAKGVSERRVILRHALRNALVPVVNFAGIGLGIALGGSFIVEGIFEYPGVGYLFFRSIGEQNDPVVLAIAVYSTITFIVLSALVDVLCAYLDPRTRVN